MSVKKRGRPKAENPKSNKITVRVDDECIENLDRYCERKCINNRLDGIRDILKKLK